jgi:hypothetical protein
MHLFLDLVRPNGERVIDGGKCQPCIRKGGRFGFDFWTGGSFRNLKKKQGPRSVIFHGIPFHLIQGP